MSEPRLAQFLLGKLQHDPEIIAYVGVERAGVKRWERIVYGFRSSVTLLDGTTIPLTDATPFVLVASSTGDIIDAIALFEPLPDGTRAAGESELAIEEQIRSAFANVECPPREQLSDSTYGDEPALLREEFAGVSNWSAVDRPEFLDTAPDGFSSALSFFSSAAFRYYIPAYMIADLRGGLSAVQIYFHLTTGLTNLSRIEQLPDRFAAWSREEAAAAHAYLRWKRARDAFARKDIDEAIWNFWMELAERGSVA